MKAAVRDATGLSCSIGISPNKLLSKICSDLDKPDGITILAMEDIPVRIWPLSVKKINGIGPKAAGKLATLGIGTIGELAVADPVVLQRHFGLSYAQWLLDASRGIDESPVTTYSEPKSISRETTFEKDLHPRHDRESLSELFTDLCARVANDLKQKGYRGRTIGIKLRYDDFQTVTRDSSLPAATDDPLVIRQAAGECLRRVSLKKKLRLLGVRVSALHAVGESEPVDPGVQVELPL